ncbi:MAG: DUF1186 domain-containing protein [Candidatus Aenigmarchaeota archaeon]|nr:DUF1186 domain-containing protein [Candidatus Aenigmarchaeota archaeon]MDI6722328.1 DUF1186 domain-containing protein [Candidatus Aenigmarchaeota archaeon]
MMQAKNEISSLQTQELIEKLVSSGLMVDRNLVEEIAKREESADYLLNILREDEYWNSEEKGDGWPPIHAIFILGLIGSQKAFDALKYALQEREDELGDWVTEDVPSILFAFGKCFLGQIREIALGESFNMYVRLVAIDALCAMSITDKELIPPVAEVCKNFLEDENDEMVCLALPPIAEVKDDGLFEKAKEAYKSRAFSKDVTKMEDLEELHNGTSDLPVYPRCTTSLWDHFSEEKLNRFWKGNYESHGSSIGIAKKNKVGRNDPCPCGSGKKYKKCCLEIRSDDSMTKTLQLKITLEGIKPLIWRRFLVSDSITFRHLHEIIQSVMGWEDCHLYRFDIDGMLIERDDEGLFADSVWTFFAPRTASKPASKIKLNEFLTRESQRVYYMYDFGDSWRHIIVLEKILEKHDYKQLPVCIGGEMACPPEDCGGIYGYEELLEIRKDENHPRYREMIVEWLGEDFEPDHFDAEEVNEELRTLINI